MILRKTRPAEAAIEVATFVVINGEGIDKRADRLFLSHIINYILVHERQKKAGSVFRSYNRDARSIRPVIDSAQSLPPSQQVPD
jgi:hypothetical protein